MGVPQRDVRVLAAEDPELEPSADPARSRARLDEATWADAELDTARARILECLSQDGSALASRTNPGAHLTGSAAVVHPDRSRLALLLHSKLGRWLQPGGHADGDHELAGVALKEAAEETGIEDLRVVVPAIDVDIHSVEHGDALGRHLHLDLRFLVLAPEGAELRGNHESRDLRWVSLEELEDLADEPGLVRLARAGLERASQVAAAS